MILLLTGLLFTSFSSRTFVSTPGTDSTLAKVTSEVGVYVRKAPQAQSAILKTALGGELFPLLKATNSKWLEVRVGDSVGYINKRFAEVELVHHDIETGTEAFLTNSHAGYEVLFVLVFFTGLIRWLRKLDRKRVTMELHYEVDEKFQQIYQQFGIHFNAFPTLRECGST